jgi:hypothetical protein
MDGAVGPVGPAGPPGADGADGVDGIDGIDGSSIVTLAEVLNNGNTTTEGTFSGDIIISTGDSILSAAELTITAATSFDILGSIGSSVVVSGATEDLTLGARGATITLNELGQESLSTTSFSATSIIGALNELVSMSMGGVGTLAATLAVGNTTGGSNVILSGTDSIQAGGNVILSDGVLDSNSGLTIASTNATSLTLGRVGLTTMIAGALGHAGTNSDTWSIQTAETEVTGLSGGAQTAVGIIPAKALVLGVTTRVTTAIAGATSYDVGDGVDIDHWGSGIILDSDPGDFTDNTLAWNNGPAADVVLTANGGVFTAGAVRIVVTYVSLTAPAS